MISMPDKSLFGFCIVAMAALFFLAEVTSFNTTINHVLFDIAIRLQAKPQHVPTDGVFVLIDENAVTEIGNKYRVRWPWPRDLFAALLVSLHQAGARQIAVDLTFLEPSDALLDDVLGAYAAAIPGVILAAPKNKVPVIWESPSLCKDARWRARERIGHVEYVPDRDGVIRRYEWGGSLASKLVMVHPSSPMMLLRWYGDLRQLPPGMVWSASKFVQTGYDTTFKLMRKMGVDETNPAAIALALKMLPPMEFGNAVRGKTVFVGANAAGAYDTKATPVSKVSPGVLTHYTAWANMHQNDWIREPGFWSAPAWFRANTVLAFLFSCLALVYAWRQTQVIRLGLFFLICMVMLLVDGYVLLAANFFFPPAPWMEGLVLSFIGVAGCQWHLEHKRKRAITQMFGSYVSREVVEQLIQNPASIRLGGEKKELTVYFSDLAGFTDMSEKMAPEKLLETVNAYLSEMSNFIIDAGGYLDKYIGDAIMGVFGAPQSLSNHALAACQAAILSREHLLELSRTRFAGLERPLHARIGINSGEMIVGNVGSDRKKNYSVIGDAVNLASRLEGANKEFGTTILLGERTEALARDGIVTRPIELLRVKGKQLPVQTFELIGMKGQVKDDTLKFISHYAGGYAAYRKRDFQDALAKFSAARQLRPQDQMTLLYHERVEALLRCPPPDDWDGVFTLKTK